MKIKHRKQPYPSNQCGQTCVAMILGMSIESAVVLIGKTGSTQTKDLSSVLNQYGFECDDRLTRISKKHGIPDFCILKLTVDNRHSGHWVLWNGETKTYHDPSYDFTMSQETYEGHLKYDNARITSFLEVRKK